MSEQRIAFIGKPGLVPHSFNINSEKAFKECGLNTGNLAFWFAMNQHISGHKEYFDWDVSPDYLKSNFDLIVFPAANQLNPAWDMQALADLFEKSELPLVICGLGVQSGSFHSKPEFKKGTRRFMDVVSERASRIGVRGQFTAEVLSDCGISNVEITGCPSNFISANPSLGKDNAAKMNKLYEIKRLILNLDITEALTPVVRTCFNWSLGRKVNFVNQAPLSAVQLANNELELLESKEITEIKDILSPGMSMATFESLVENSFSVYFDANEWMHQLQKFDLSVGTRMHGNMLAWQAGIPSILIPHDSRTLELSQTMGLPHLPSSKIRSDMTLEELIEVARTDGREYDFKRQRLLGLYCSVLEQSGADLSPHLQCLRSEFSSNRKLVA